MTYIKPGPEEERHLHAFYGDFWEVFNRGELLRETLISFLRSKHTEVETAFPEFKAVMEGDGPYDAATEELLTATMNTASYFASRTIQANIPSPSDVQQYFRRDKALQRVLFDELATRDPSEMSGTVQRSLRDWQRRELLFGELAKAQASELKERGYAAYEDMPSRERAQFHLGALYRFANISHVKMVSEAIMAKRTDRSSFHGLPVWDRAAIQFFTSQYGYLVKKHMQMAAGKDPATAGKIARVEMAERPLFDGADSKPPVYQS